MRKTNFVTIAALAVVLVFDLLEITFDGWNWLRGGTAALTATALVLNIIVEVKHGKTPHDE